jgi:HK97 family phage major capsid protein
MTPKELQDERATLMASMDGIVAKADENETPGEFTEEQKTEYDALDAKFDAVSVSIARREKLVEKKRTMAAVVDPNSGLAGIGKHTAPDEDLALDVGAMSAAEIVNNGAVIMALPDRGFGENGFGAFAGCVFRQATAGVSDPRLALMAAAGDPTQRMGIASDGGFLVPPSFATGIWDKVTAGDTSGQRIISSCDTFTVPFGVESVTFPAIVNTSRANGSRFGGLQGFWKDELTQMTSTTAELREVTLQPHELYVFSYISDKLLKNTSLMEQWLTSKAPEEIRFKMANAIISGTGGAQPKGLRGASGTVDQAKTSGQPKDTITATNIRKMWSRVPDASRMTGFWLYDISCEEQIAGFTQAVGTGGVPLMTPDGGISVSPFVTLLGRPLVPSEFACELGDSGDLMFVDLSAYGLAIRGGIESAVSMHLKFDFNQTAFRFLFEVDGTPMLDSAITPFTPAGGTTKTRTVSPFVTLAERA